MTDIEGQQARRFFGHLRHRMRTLALLGTVGIVGGAVGIVVLPSATVLFSVILVAAVSIMVAALSARRHIHIGESLLRHESRLLEMRTSPYRTACRWTNNRLRVTLDNRGSTSRTPLAEFKAAWTTPRLTREPRQDASVFGPLALDANVLAVSSEGCAIGRVRRVHTEGLAQPG